MIKPIATLEKLRSGKPVVVAALGDSLTQGWMVKRGYLFFLREMLLARYPYTSLTIINRGIPGDTADNGLYRLRRDILEHNPDCVLVQYALNDAFQGYSPGQFRTTMGEIIEEVRADSEADIVLLTSVYLEDDREYDHVMTYYRELEVLASDFGLPIARVHAHWEKRINEGADFGHLVQYDLVHPTEEGYRYMAEAVFELFL